MQPPLTLDPKTTALVLIDFQGGIVGLPLAPYDADRIIRNAVQLGTKLAEAGGTVVRVHVAFDSTYADKLKQPVDAPTPSPAGGLPSGYSDFVPEIEALPTQVIITKRQWGAFHGTELDLQLRRRGITTIVLAGIATNFGVESTAREAWQNNYAVVIAEDACSSVAADAHRFAIERIFPRISRVRSTAEIVEALAPK